MPWETDKSSGLLSHFNGTIVESYFGTDPRYNNGETTLLIWEIDNLEVLQEDFDGELPEPFTVSMPIGSDWYSDDGVTAEHKKGKERFHTASLYGRVIDAVTGTVANYGEAAARYDGEDLEVDLTDLSSVLEKRGDPRNAEIWKGLRFEFVEVHFDFGPDRKGNKGDRITSRRTLPVRPLDADAKKSKKSAPKSETKAEAPKSSAEDDKAAKVAAAKERAAAAKAAKEEPKTNGNNPFTELVQDGDLAETLGSILESAPDYDAFVSGCLDVDEVNTDDELLAAILDEDNGPWANGPQAKTHS